MRAGAYDVDVLVLGAFGCGAFNNPPEMVADVFGELLRLRGYGRCFKQVVFAIKGHDGENQNLQVFREALEALEALEK